MTSSFVNDDQNPLPKPLVWVLVLHYQNVDCTRACLRSLQALTYPNFRVLLLDNGSPDNSGEAVAAEFPDYDFVHLEENHGFAGGCNKGVAYCVERGAKWVWLLNNDTVVAPDSLSLLVEQACSNARAGALGGLIYTPDGDLHVPVGMGEIDFVRGKTYQRRKPPAKADCVDCDWLSGCNLLVRVNAFEALGGFDERYFLYFEDTDLCVRMRNAGWQCLLVPRARIEHRGGASTEGRLNIWRTYYYTRNRMLFFRAHAKGASLLPIALSICAHLARHALVLPFRGERGRRQLRAEMLGLRDYLSGKLGRAECLDW